MRWHTAPACLCQIWTQKLPPLGVLGISWRLEVHSFFPGYTSYIFSGHTKIRYFCLFVCLICYSPLPFSHEDVVFLCHQILRVLSHQQNTLNSSSWSPLLFDLQIWNDRAVMAVEHRTLNIFRKRETWWHPTTLLLKFL